MSQDPRADLAKLQAKRDAMDQDALDRLNAHKAIHADPDATHLKWRREKKYLPEHEANARNCHNCVELVCLRSLNHDIERANGKEVCVDCKIEYDMFGLPKATTHHRYQIADSVDPDGTPRPGLLTLLANGTVRVDVDGKFSVV